LLKGLEKWQGAKTTHHFVGFFRWRTIWIVGG